MMSLHNVFHLFFLIPGEIKTLEHPPVMFVMTAVLKMLAMFTMFPLLCLFMAAVLVTLSIQIGNHAAS